MAARDFRMRQVNVARRLPADEQPRLVEHDRPLPSVTIGNVEEWHDPVLAQAHGPRPVGFSFPQSATDSSRILRYAARASLYAVSASVRSFSRICFTFSFQHLSIACRHHS